jgi:hypothetical protein
MQRLPMCVAAPAATCARADLSLDNPNHQASSSSSSSSEGSKPAAAAAAAGAAAAEEEDEDEAKKSEEYTADMQAKMGNGLTYRHEDGINWNHIMPDLIVGSCLQVRLCVGRRLGFTVRHAGTDAPCAAPHPAD